MLSSFSSTSTWKGRKRSWFRSSIYLSFSADQISLQTKFLYKQFVMSYLSSFNQPSFSMQKNFLICFLLDPDYWTDLFKVSNPSIWNLCFTVIWPQNAQIGSWLMWIHLRNLLSSKSQASVLLGRLMEIGYSDASDTNMLHS